MSCVRNIAAAIGALALSLVCAVTAALAEKRVALVIGNGAYQKVGPLTNPARDAAAVEALFKSADFDVVRRLTDLNGSNLRRALRDFADDARDADVAVVFFAGHGIEVNGTNYLIPIDAVLERDIDVEDETVSLDRVNQIVEPAKVLRLIILDACRDNPFLATMRRTTAGRSVGRGLGRVEVPTSNTLVAYAARAGSIASDGQGQNSPFTAALLTHLATPGLDVQLALRRVRDDVLKATVNKQEPFTYGSLGGQQIAVVKAGPASAVPVPVVQSEAARDWQDVKASTSLAALQGFLARHKTDPIYAPLAEERIAALRRATASPQPIALQPSQSSARVDRVAALQPGLGGVARDTLADGTACADCPDMVVAPAGAFIMGSESTEPQRIADEEVPRPVTVPAPFAIGRTSITVGQYLAFLRDTGRSVAASCETWDGKALKFANGRSVKNPGYTVKPELPGTCVSWRDAKDYAEWLSKKTGHRYRLPSEAEREYASRAGSADAFTWGRDIDTSKANYDGEHRYNGGKRGTMRASPIGVTALPPNRWGLHHVHGNVWEWTEDCYAKPTAAKSDSSPVMIAGCNVRVIKGGAWLDEPYLLRSAARLYAGPDARSVVIGFRVVRDL
jgi:formylglycine-generating enzyme required for sulfatase activity